MLSLLATNLGSGRKFDIPSEGCTTKYWLKKHFMVKKSEDYTEFLLLVPKLNLGTSTKTFRRFLLQIIPVGGFFILLEN